VLIECGTLQGRKVEGNRWSGILILPQEVMTGEVVLGELYKLGGRKSAHPRKDLGMDMAAELLYSDLAKPSFRRNYAESEEIH
jgi:hypothetical protein